VKISYERQGRKKDRAFWYASTRHRGKTKGLEVTLFLNRQGYVWVIITSEEKRDKTNNMEEEGKVACLLVAEKKNQRVKPSRRKTEPGRAGIKQKTGG